MNIEKGGSGGQEQEDQLESLREELGKATSVSDMINVLRKFTIDILTSVGIVTSNSVADHIETINNIDFNIKASPDIIMEAILKELDCVTRRLGIRKIAA